MDQLAGYLRKKGFEIDIKYFSNKKNAEEVVNELNLDYKMIAFSINNSNYNKCCEIAKIIKKKKKLMCFLNSLPSLLSLTLSMPLTRQTQRH